MTMRSTSTRFMMRTSIACFALPLCLVASTASAAPDLDVLAGAAFGDDLGVRPHALDLDREGNVVVAGDGTLVRIDAAGDPTGPLVRLDARIDDIAVDRTTGNVVVLSAGELRVFDPSLVSLWQRATEADRVAVGERGTIAAASSHAVEIVAASGERRGRIAGGHRIAAVAVIDAHDLVVVAGSNTADCDVDRVTLEGFDTRGLSQWSAFTGCGSAATRGVDVARGDDGMIYVIAEIEAGGDPLLGTAEVAFDESTARARIESPLFAYYARFTPAGGHLGGQYLGFADALSVVEPGSIAADRESNVHVTGITTHSIAEPDEVAGEAEIVDALSTPSGFYQVVSADFGSRLAWKQLDLDDGAAAISSLALAGDLVVTLLQHDASATTTIAAWPTTQAQTEKKPDREDVGTFGYESGIAGADPTCYCDASRTRGTGLVGLAMTIFVLGFVRRRRRC